VRVVVIPADRGGCGYYRLIWPAQAVSLARPDWQVEVRPPETVQAGFVDGRFVGVQGLPDPGTIDVLVMQRVGTPGQINVARWARERGAAVVVDFDDAMWCIDRDNVAWPSWNMRNPYDQHWKTCDVAAAEADLVTVTTEHLAKHYGKAHRRVDVINNHVPQAAVSLEPLPRSPKDPFTAGWVGFTQTHPGDCEVSGPAARAVLDSGGGLAVVADGPGAAREWGVDEAQVRCIPGQKFGPSYYQSLSVLDLMLVGLKDTPFNRAKSTLKVLEAAAAGVPSVAPDNPPHRDLARRGFPVTLASSPTEWATAAKRHASDPSYSAEQKEATAEAVTGWTIEGNAGLWADAWERAARLRRLR